MNVILAALQAAFLLRVETANGFSSRCRRQETADTTAFLARHDDTHGLTHDYGEHAEDREIKDTSRRELMGGSITALASGLFLLPNAAVSKCTDIESCREEGERRIEADLKSNPIAKLENGVRYRVLQLPASSSTKAVQEGSNIDMIFSISTASGQYMYSKGFGFEKVDFGGKQVNDSGLDSLRVIVGKQDVPVGIEEALVGMRKGERRRVELPPGVGFETSEWRPEPTARRGIVQIEQYKRKLAGFGSQPPFPAETVWDIEVLNIR